MIKRTDEEAKRITLRMVTAMKPGDLVWDADVIGFGVRCQRKAKVYVVKYRVAGRQRWYTIGRHGSPWTPEAARREAKRIVGMVADKTDPAIEREKAKAGDTVADFVALFLAEHVEAKRKPSTIYQYRKLLTRLVIPALGRRRLVDVSRADVARLHHALKLTPYQANRMLAVLSKMFSWAERHGYRPDDSNPCRHVEKYAERCRERFLSEVETARLADVLADAERTGSEGPYVVAAVRLLMFTGARLGEILGLRWEHVDFERAMLRLPDSKTGQKTIWLNPPALAVLDKLPRVAGNPHVIVGERDGQHLVNLEKPWRRIRAAATVRVWRDSVGTPGDDLVERLAAELEREPTLAECRAEAKRHKVELPGGLDDVRLHDLRHSFASVAAAGGLSLPMIGKLLGHASPATTARYAHLAADPVTAAADKVGRTIASMMEAKPGDVLQFHRRKMGTDVTR